MGWSQNETTIYRTLYHAALARLPQSEATDTHTLYSPTKRKKATTVKTYPTSAPLPIDAIYDWKVR